MNKFFAIGIVVLIVGVLWWGVRSLTNLPGEVVEDLGREHWPIEQLREFTYNSNPPTSGPHDPDWIRAGVFETPQDKYKLIHSLEHGYVEVHYNCEAVVSIKPSILSVGAHEDPGDLDNDEPDEPSTASGALNERWQTEDCKQLAQILRNFHKQHADAGRNRLIVTPNPELTDRIALVAWGRIMKLGDWNESEATRFVKAFHNRGPEQTME